MSINGDENVQRLFKIQKIYMKLFLFCWVSPFQEIVPVSSKIFLAINYLKMHQEGLIERCFGMLTALQNNTLTV